MQCPTLTIVCPVILSTATDCVAFTLSPHPPSSVTQDDRDLRLHGAPQSGRSEDAANVPAAEKLGSFEDEQHRSIFGNMRKVSLRLTSEKAMAIFNYSVIPRADIVDANHVPTAIMSSWIQCTNDQQRVSLLNYYLMVTGRSPRAATELGYAASWTEPRRQ